MKPKIFLSHSKKDKVFIEKLANDLRSCGIDVWYDEWEIPPGESIRKKIFEDGITSCDLFFIYLTENSIPSYWVQKELDGAFIHEIELENSFVALFVNTDESRKGLSLDLKALNIPPFNEVNYTIPFGKLITKTWNSYIKKQIKNKEQDYKIQVLELEKKVLQLQSNSQLNVPYVKEMLESKTYSHNEITKNLLELFLVLKDKLADGINNYHLIKILGNQFKEDIDSWIPNENETFRETYSLSDFTGELILKGLVEIKTSNDLDQFYYLSKQGIEFIEKITTGNTVYN
jgi:hypothetical protein